MRHTDFWPWKDSDSPRSRERNTLDHGRYRKRRDINDLCLSESPLETSSQRKVPCIPPPNCCKGLKCNYQVCQYVQPGCYHLLLNLAEKSIRNSREGPHVLHLTSKTAVNTSKCLLEPLPLAITQSFSEAEECHVAGDVDTRD